MVTTTILTLLVLPVLYRLAYRRDDERDGAMAQEDAALPSAAP